MEFTKEDLEYMDYLNGLPAPDDWALLLYKGDPIAFELGKDEYFSQKQFEDSTEE